MTVHYVQMHLSVVRAVELQSIRVRGAYGCCGGLVQEDRMRKGEEQGREKGRGRGNGKHG